MATNVRVTARKHRGGRTEDKDRTFRTLLSDFKRACNDANVLQDLKRKQFFESPIKKEEKNVRLLPRRDDREEKNIEVKN